MKSSLDIIEKVYQLINVTSVTSIISGKVYATGRPSSSQLEDIEINTLANNSEYLQLGFVNINIYVKEIEAGRPNLAKFKQVIDVLIPLLDDVKLDEITIQIDDDKGIFKDNEKDNEYFYNLKLTYQTT